jgi:hypothetical protein
MIILKGVDSCQACNLLVTYVFAYPQKYCL